MTDEIERLRAERDELREQYEEAIAANMRRAYELAAERLKGQMQDRNNAERDALRAELAAAKNDERRNWVKALLEVLPEEKSVLFREICVARDKLEKIKGGEDE